MTTKYRIHVHHLVSNNHFYSETAEMSDHEHESTLDFLKSLASEGTYFTFKQKDGNSVIISKEILRNSVFFLEKVEA
jgi:hypothetical protein